MRLFFSGSQSKVPDEVREYIHVWPVDSGWNDFGYGFQAAGKVVLKGRPDFDFRALVVPWDKQLLEDRFNIWLSKTFKGSSDRAVEVSAPRSKFLTIMRSDAYERLAMWAESSTTLLDDILDSLNDVVWMRWRKRNADVISAFSTSRAIQLGVFRDEVVDRNFRDGWRYLSGTPFSYIEDSAQGFGFEVDLSGFDGSYRLELEFSAEPPLPGRCHVLVGSNGVGKTRLLRAMVAQFASIKGVDRSLLAGDGETVARFFGTSGPPLASRVIVLGWGDPESYANQIPPDLPFEYLYFPNYPASEAEGSEDLYQLVPMLVQIIRDPTIDGKVDRLATLRKALSPHLRLRDLAVCLQEREGQNKRSWIPVSDLLMGGEQHRLELLGSLDPSSKLRVFVDENPVSLSSGQYSITSFLIRIVCSIVQGSLIFLDEPETHLHPNMISEMMQSLHTILEESKSVAIVATHSPFVVREVPSAYAHVMKVNEDSVPSIGRSYLRTLGASVESLAVDIFGDSDVRKNHERIARKIARMGMSMDKIIAKYGSQVSGEMLSLIREIKEGVNAND